MRSDIFSLGVVLYEMVAGRAPFTGPTDSHVRVSIIDQDPKPLSQQSGQVPRQLDRIVAKALAKDRTKRYQTITDLKLDLEQLRAELTDLKERTESLHDDTADISRTRAGDRVTSADTTRILTRQLTPNLREDSFRHTKRAVDLACSHHRPRCRFRVLQYSRPKITSVAFLPFAND